MRMKMLISQPRQEKGIDRLEFELENNIEVEIFVYPEGYLNDELTLSRTCCLAKKYKTMIITGYKDKSGKDRAVIIDNKGEKILDRAKTPIMQDKLVEPVVVSHDVLNIGYILCMEILKGTTGFEWDGEKINFFAHPIGTGMFSNEQFEEWIEYAKSVAKKYNTMIVGASHADGSYKNCGISIPISYCIDSRGEVIFISKSDVRTRIVDLKTKEFEIVLE